MAPQRPPAPRRRHGGHGLADALDDTFAYGLGALLDGLEARLKAA
ncbi:hypothetical protein ABZ572_13445 [Streptomyces sp. NPDC018338]